MVVGGGVEIGLFFALGTWLMASQLLSNHAAIVASCIIAF